MTDTSLARLDAVAQAELVRTGDASATELVAAAIARIEALNPSVNAVVHRSFERALEQAEGGAHGAGPFAGVPFLMKDLWPASAGDPWHLGNPGLAAAGHTAREDSNITRRYREAGFVLLGRTNTPELGLVATTEPVAHGATANPWSTTHGAGGSSGGAAAAVAAGMVPAANASDGGGSIRIPAALCGLVGLKPSRGRVSMGPFQEEWGVSVQHVVSHSVRDCAAILDATAIPHLGDGVVAPPPVRPWAHEAIGDHPRLRIGIRTDSPTSEVETSCREATEQIGLRLGELGHTVEAASPAAIDEHASLSEHFINSWAVNARLGMDAIGAMLGREITSADVEPSTWAIAEVASGISGLDYARAQSAFGAFRRSMATWWEDYDLLLTPTTARPAPPLGDLVSRPEEPLHPILASSPFAAFTAMFNTTGQPAISIPAGSSPDGLPVGAQLAAAYGREDQLLAVAFELEAALDWAAHRSPLHP